MSKQSLFSPLVSKAAYHLFFRRLLEHRGWLPAREMLNQAFDRFVDVDGNFVKDFQSTGFNARVWELFLNEAFLELGFSIDRSRDRPDFLISKEGFDVCVEAMTAGPPQNSIDSSILETPLEDIEERVADEINGFMPIRLGGALTAKLKKRYWELPHVTGKPLVFAVAAFVDETPIFRTNAALMQYLYGVRHLPSYDKAGRLAAVTESLTSHSHGSKTIPSGFFGLPDAEHVSAVIFNNGGTIAKFNRIGHESGIRSPIVSMVRIGTCYDHDPNAAKPQDFEYRVLFGQRRERWSQGTDVFLNPNALHPIPPDFFDRRLMAVGSVVDGKWDGTSPSFHPFTSITDTRVRKEKTSGWSPKKDRNQKHRRR